MIKVGKEDQYPKFQSFIYAHGELENVFGTDLISSTEDLPIGITEVELGSEIYGTAFVYERSRPLPLVGIVCMNSDEKSMEYGKFLMEHKPSII